MTTRFTAWRTRAAAGALALSAAACATTAPMIDTGVDLDPPDPTPTTVSRAADCDRACLEGMVDIYFAAVIADDPSAAPLSDDVRFTENGQVLPLYPVAEGLWKSMKAAGSYRLFVTDPDAGQVTLITTVVEDDRTPEGGVGALMTLRLKVEDGLITEIEQIVERDDATAQRVEALGSPRDALLAPVPESERMSRADIIETANKYFTGMQMNDGMGDYPFGDRCDRLENGGRSTNVPPRDGQPVPDPATATGYSASWSCLEQFQSGMLHFVSHIRDRRWVAVDQERGLAAAFGFFDHQAGSTRQFTLPSGREMIAGPAQPWTWEIFEIFKIENGQIQEIEATLAQPPYGMISGWSTWENGHSDASRDVTGYIEP